MFNPITIIIYLAGIIWIYQDGLKLRKKGVPVNPGLVVGLILLAFYLIFWVGIIPSLFYQILGYSWLSYPVQLLIPFLVYLVLRLTRYKKIAAQGNPPLPPARRWGFWFMIGVFLAPFILMFFIYLGFRNFNW